MRQLKEKAMKELRSIRYDAPKDPKRARSTAAGASKSSDAARRPDAPRPTCSSSRSLAHAGCSNDPDDVAEGIREPAAAHQQPQDYIYASAAKSLAG